MSNVVVVECRDYLEENVNHAVERLLSLLDWPSCCHYSGPLLLKPNLLAADPPERSSTTHPQVVKSLAAAMQSGGSALSIGDSPIFGASRKVAQKCGFQKICQDMGISLLDFAQSETIEYNGRGHTRVFELASAALHNGRIVSVSKLKTHALAGMTGAVKNQLGCVSGIDKGKMHAKLPDIEAFCSMLIDLNLMLDPVLYVMDAVVGMEGNGPRGGQPRPVGCLLASLDPVALDSVAASLIGFRPEEIPTNRIGHREGLGTMDMEQITILGDDWRQFRVEDYVHAHKTTMNYLENRYIRRLLMDRPTISKESCVDCGICVHSCPQDPRAVVRRENNVPVFDYESCLRCFCCQESCPEGAIYIRTTFLGKVVSLFM